MSNTMELELDAKTSRTILDGLLGEIRQLNAIEGAQDVKPRIVDPVSLMVWVKLAAATVPVIASVVELVRKKGLKGVRIKAGDKTIEVDSASPDEVKQLLRAMEEDAA